MGIGVLGPLEVDRAPVNLGTRDRVVLQALALRHGSAVTADALAESIWGESLPRTWPKVVQGCIVRLRHLLGADAIETTDHGYVLRAHVDHLDARRFEQLVARARELLRAGEAERASFLLAEALGLWRGEPFPDLQSWEPARAESERLNELRREAEDLRVEALLRAGQHDAVRGLAQQLVRDAPFREHRWALLALAQYRAGQQHDALRTLQKARAVLAAELGLDPSQELAELEEAILRQDASLAAKAALPEPSRVCPYPGLVAYGVADAPTFYGREEVTAACLRRLDEVQTLAVAGPSGCGKSSLARAGVAAALEHDGHRVFVITPGTHPMSALAGVGSRPGTVLVVDQCEEALALADGSPERIEFFAALVEFSQRHSLVITMRADRIGELAPHRDFATLVERGLYLLGPMAQTDLRVAIEGPAAQAGLRLEPGLVDLLVREVAGEPAALPLVSHVLRQTWRNRQGNTLTVQGYAATGGVRAAVAQSAEGVFRGLDHGHQATLRDLMLRLVAPDEGGEPVRTRVPRRSVTGDQDRVRLVEQLLAARLLATDGDSIEIAHESLAVAWPRLRSWLDEDIDGARTLRHLTVASESWDHLGRPDSELYRGVRQARATEWHQRAGATLTDTERDFLKASAALADKEQRATEAQVQRERQLNRRLRAGLAVVVALLAVALVTGAIAKTAANRADQQARAADARRLGAEALRSDALDQSLLLAAAGVTLDDSVDTRNYLLATLGRVKALVASARSPQQVVSLSVNTGTGQVAAIALGGVGLELYDGRTLRPVSLPRSLPGASVSASPDGRRYAMSVRGDLVQDGTEPPVLLLDPNGARSAVQLGGFPSGYFVFDNLGFGPISPDNMEFSANSRWLAVAMRDLAGRRPDTTVVWDLRSPGRPVAMVHLGEVRAPTVSPDGHTLYSVSTQKRRLQVTDLPSGRTRRTLGARDLGVRQLDDILVESRDARMLALGAGVEAVVLDRATLKPRAYLAGQGQTTGLAFSPDDTQVAASGEHLMVWEIHGHDVVKVLVQDGQMDHPSFSRDGRTLYTRTYSGLVQEWDLAGDRRFLTARAGDPLSWSEPGPRISPDDRTIGYVTLGPEFRIRDVATGRLGPVVPGGMAQGRFLDIAWHPDSKTVNITSGDPLVRTWDSTTGRLIAERRLAPAPSTEGAAIAFFSVNGKYLLVGTTAGRLHVLNARTLVPARAPIQVYKQKTGEQQSKEVFVFSPSGD
ncbi:MAG TPA: BTAD domain-containing putative transcriptional regulator, partial [Pedococcus sp.]|nr:BTAD domain-containing putative transcriptional regulator [Pedococcus sp.]